MEYVIRFAISLFDLAVFMYYFHSNKKMKPVSKVWIWAGFTIAAVIWTFVSSIKKSVSESCDSFDCAYTVIILLYIRNVDENYKYCDIHGYWNAV